MGSVLTRTGVVKAIQGRMALVITKMEPGCEGCKAKEACFSFGGGGVNTEVRTRNTVGAEVGDIVTISMRSSSLVKVSFLVYMLPILGLIGGIVLGYSLARLIPVDENILVGICGLFAFSGTFAWVRNRTPMPKLQITPGKRSDGLRACCVHRRRSAARIGVKVQRSGLSDSIVIGLGVG